MRESGILLPIFSLPSEYGIGCFSKEAYEFVDQLKKAGQRKWQILPLGPTGYGDSPYQSFSTFAGNPYFIDLEKLIEEGLLTKKECDSMDFGKEDDAIDYEKMYHARFDILRIAYERFTPCDAYRRFEADNAHWLEDYCLYMAIKDSYEGEAWTEWESGLRNRQPQALENVRQKYADEVAFYKFQQYKFHEQWTKLHRYANENDIEIIGDIPIYVAFDSADTWASPELFQFDEEHLPVAVAGCPPDGFSATGQLWGNPLYRWEYHKQTNYQWWAQRMSYMLKLYDVVRVDHFRGFDEYYSIPYGNKTAEKGQWEKGPGMDLFCTLADVLGKMNVIAEDLGYLTDTVRQLVKDSGYPGMKVLEFAFDSREESDYLPHNYDKNCVVYTGTHDNNTIQGWYDTIDNHDKEFALRYMNNQRTLRKEIHLDFVRMAMASVADLCVTPIQDYMGLGEEARINTPSTLGENWKWRLKKGQINKTLLEEIREMTKLYGRLV